MANYTNSPSGNVDEHVVKMTFDNKQFEKNAQQSLDTVEKLKSSMNFEATVKGLDKLEDGVAQSNKALDSLNDSVDKIKDRFSNLGIIGVTALQNITNSAINLGKQMVKSLTINPIQSGFNEYELKMNSMKTIVASTGESVQTVNKYLNELNKYSDETIYSFSDMTSNIGKFTNAGVDLKTAVNAIKGVSSEAALAGANANEASRAMYNFSQALSAGYVKLIDWKSIENANMATKDFKQNLIDTAVALGKVKKQGDMYVSTTKNMNGKTSAAFNATKNFNDSLAHQWMTTDVLTTTLEAYSHDLIKSKSELASMTSEQRKAYEQEKKQYEQDMKRKGFTDKQIKRYEQLGHKAMQAAKEINTFSKMVDTLQEAVQSSWAATSEYIFGTLDQAKKLWTNLEQSIEKVIMAHNNLRNEVLKDWNQLGGRSALIKSFQNIGSSIESVFKPIKEAFLGVFKPFEEVGGLGKNLEALTERFKNFTAGLKLTDQESNDLRETFKGLFIILKDAMDTIKKVGSVVINIVKTVFRPIIDILLKIGSTISKVVQIVDYSVRVVITIVKTLYDYFIGINKTIQFFNKIFNSIVNFINKGLDKINQWLGKITGSTIKSGKAAATVGDIVIKVIRAIYQALVTVYYYGLFVIRNIVIAVGAVGIVVAGAVATLVRKIIHLPAIARVFKWLDDQFSVTAQAAEKSNKKISKSSKSTAQYIQKNWDKLSFKDKAALILLGIVEKVKEGVKSLINITKSGIDTAVKFFSNFVNDIKKFGFKTAILNAFKSIGNGFLNLVNTIKNELANANIPQPIKNFFNFVINMFKTIKTAVGDFFSFLASKFPIFKSFKEFVDNIKKSFDGLFGVDAKANPVKKTGKQIKDTKNKADGLKTALEGVANAFKKLGSAVVDFMKNLNASKIFMFLMSGVLLFMLTSIARLIWKMGNQTEVVTNGFLKQLGNLTGSLNTFVKGMNNHFFPTQKTFVLKIREMAESVAILAGSVMLLSTIDKDKLWGSVGAVAVLAAVMGGLSITMAVISKLLTPEQMGTYKVAITNMIALAASIAAVAVSIKILDSISDMENLGYKLIAFVTAFAAFVTALTIAQHFWKNGMSVGNTAGVLFFALSLKKIAKAIVFIADIDFTKIKKGLSGFAICISALAVLAVAFGRAKWHSGANAIGFAISLWLLIIPIKKLAKVDYSNFTKALTDLQGIIITLSVIAGTVLVVGTICKKGRASIHATGDFIKALGTSLIGLTVSIAILGSMKRGMLKRGIKTVAGLITFMTVSMALLAFGTKGVNVRSSFKTLMGIVLGVSMLVGGVIVLGMVDSGILAKGTIVIGSLLTLFGLCLKLSSGAKDVKMGPIIAVALSCISLGMIVGLLGSMPFGKMMQGILGMALIVGALAALMFTIKSMAMSFSANVKFKTIMISMVLSLISVATTVGILTAVVAHYGIQNMIAACAGMAGVMLALAGTFAIMTAAGATGSAAGAAFVGILIGCAALFVVGLSVVGVIELLGYILSQKGAMNNVKKFAKFLNTMFKPFKDITKAVIDPVINFVKSLSKVNVKQVTAAAKVLSSLTKLIQAGSDFGFSSITDSFDSEAFSELMIGLADGVIAFKQAISDAGGITDDDVKAFSTTLTAFSKICKASKGLKPKDAESLQTMMNTIYGFDNEGPTITDYNTGIGGFARTFGETVKILKNYKFKDDDIDLFDHMVTALGDIVTISKKIPNSSDHGLGFSWASAIVGDNRLDDFLYMIAGDDNNPGLGEALGKAIKAMNSKAINEDNAAKLEKGITILGEVASMSGDIENSGGLLGNIMGNNDLAPFLKAIAGDKGNKGGLGDALKSAITAMAGKDITKDNVKKLKMGIKALAEVASLKGDVGDSAHPFMDFINNLLNKKDTFTQFLEALPGMGTNLAKACSAFKGVDSGSVSNMYMAMTALGNMIGALTINNSDGSQTVYSIKKFSKDLSKSTDDFQKFSDAVGGYDLEGMKAFGAAIKTMCSDLKSAAKNTKNFAGLGGKLQTFANSMTTLNNASFNWNGASNKELSLDANKALRSSSKSKDLSDLMDSIKQIGVKAKKIDTGSIKHLTNITKAFTDSCKTIESVVNGAKKSLDNAKPSFEKKGQNFITALIQGIASKNKDVQARATATANIFYNKINTYGKPKMKSSGILLLKGLIEGLKDPKTISEVEATAKNVGTKANDAVRKEVDERSPSHKWQKYGVYMLLGMKKGLEDRGNLSKLEKSSKSVGSTVDDSVRKELQIHSPSKKAISTAGHYISGLFKGLTSNSAFSAISKGGKMVAEILNGSILGNFDPQKSIQKAMKKFDIKMPNLQKALTKGLSELGAPDFSKFTNSSYKSIETAVDNIAKNSALMNGITGVNVSDGTKGSKGSKGSKGKNSAGKGVAKAAGMSESDIQKVIDAYTKVFYRITPTLDRFNKKYINKRGKINANYIAHSFKNSLSRRAAVYFAKDMAETINTEFGKYAKKNGLKNGTKAYYKELKNFTYGYMKEAQNDMNRMYSRFGKFAGKKGLNVVKNYPELIATYVKKFTPAAKKFTSIVNTGVKQFNTSKENMGKGLQNFGDYLWDTSDEGIENRKNLKDSLNQESSLRKKMKIEKDKLDNAETKSTKKKTKEAKISMNNAKKAMDLAKKQGKYQGKSYKEWESIYKKRKKKYNDLANQRSTSAKRLSTLEGKLQEQQKKTVEYTKKDAEGANKALKEYKKNLEDTLKDYLKLSASNFKNPITAFQKKMYNGTQKFYESGKAGKQLVDYTYTQMKVYKNYQDDMKWAQSTASGLSASVVKYFKDAGYESYDELHKLRYATKEEIDELNGYFEESEQIKKRAFIQDAIDKLQAVKDRDENIKVIAASGILSPEAIKDLIDQGMDAADLVSSIADDIKNNGGTFAKQYSDLFNEVGMSKLNDSQFITEETKSIMADLGYAWDEGTKQFVKSDTIQQTASIVGETFIDALAKYLKETGMSDSAIKKVKNVLSPLAKETFTSFDDFMKEANKLDLDKVFKKSTLDKIERFANANNISGAITATANASTASIVSQPTASKDTSGAITVIDSTGKAVTTTSSSTDLQASKESTLNAIVDPKAQDTLKTSIDTTYTAQLVTNINDSMAKLLTEQNKKLDKLHNDNQRIYDTLNKTRSDLRTTNGEVKNLKSAISHMRVQMDTGALVGAITPGVDKALGRKASSTRR